MAVKFAAVLEFGELPNAPLQKQLTRGRVRAVEQRSGSRVMSEKDPIRIFVTHVFSDHPDYLRVFEYLESVTNFFYSNCSKIDEMPATGGKEAIKEVLLRQIRAAETVIVIGSMFDEAKDWVTFQMDAAQAASIPLIALEPFGGSGKLPAEVAGRANEAVGWNDRLIVDAIRRQARGEDTQRWETIEFDLG